MSASAESPSQSRLGLRRLQCDAHEMSHSVYTDRLLVYKPIVSAEAKLDPPHSNTKGQAPSGRNVGKLAGLLNMPQDVFCEVIYED